MTGSLDFSLQQVHCQQADLHTGTDDYRAHDVRPGSGGRDLDDRHGSDGSLQNMQRKVQDKNFILF